MFKKFIGDRAFYRRALAVALPILIQNSITQFVSLLDNIMVGQVGTAQMSGVAKLVGTDTIACSATNMWQCLVNCISWGIKEEDVIRACTYNPACALSAQGEVGSIESGKAADFVICNADYSGRRVFLAGQEI